MTTKKLAASDELAAGTTRRGAGALPLCVIVPPTAGKCKPPAHLTPHEAELWAAAEALQGSGDRQAFWDARREFLLEQSRRYPAR